jgi:hypothetical protein
VLCCVFRKKGSSAAALDVHSGAEEEVKEDEGITDLHCSWPDLQIRSGEEATVRLAGSWAVAGD